MKKILFLFAVAAFAAGCGANTGNTNTAANKSNAAPANANSQANNPASTPAANTNANSDTGAASNEELDFTLVNKTGYDIKQVSIGPNGDKDWLPEDEVLKGRKFGNGESLEIKFNPKATAKNWDIMVEWADGTGTEEWLNLNLTEIEKVTLVYNKEKDETSAIIE